MTAVIDTPVQAPADAALRERRDFEHAQAYVGTDYIAGEYDCGHLFLDVQREVFGRARAVATSTPHPLGRAHQAVHIKAIRDEIATRIPDATHGCAVLITGTADDGGTLWHVGTVFMNAGQAWVLHNSAVMGGAALTPLKNFAWLGQKIEGFYACK